MKIPGLAHGFADLSEVRLHYVTAGRGPLVLLLHGFPEAWFAFRRQIGPLAQAGYRVVAPDLRGYGASDKPPDVAAYTLDRLVGDVRDLVDHFGGRAAAVVGHDWGGVLTYLFGHRFPERTDRLVVANAPHPGHLAAALADPAQLRRSWYVFFFQLPLLPERYGSAFDHARLRRIFRMDPVRPGAFSKEDVEAYIQAVGAPESRFGTVSYYRGLLRPPSLALLRDLVPLKVPAWVLWGMQDRYLGPALAAPPPHLVPRFVLRKIPDASHWVLADRPTHATRFFLSALAPPVGPSS